MSELPPLSAVERLGAGRVSSDPCDTALLPRSVDRPRLRCRSTTGRPVDGSFLVVTGEGEVVLDLSCNLAPPI